MNLDPRWEGRQLQKAVLAFGEGPYACFITRLAKTYWNGENWEVTLPPARPSMVSDAGPPSPRSITISSSHEMLQSAGMIYSASFNPTRRLSLTCNRWLHFRANKALNAKLYPGCVHATDLVSATMKRTGFFFFFLFYFRLNFLFYFFPMHFSTGMWQINQVPLLVGIFIKACDACSVL